MAKSVYGYFKTKKERKKERENFFGPLSQGGGAKGLSGLSTKN